MKGREVAVRAQFKKETIHDHAICFVIGAGSIRREPAPEDRPQDHRGACRQHQDRWVVAQPCRQPGEGPKGDKSGKTERYQIVSGSRRFEALRLLEQRGELPEDFTVAVEVRDDLSKDQTLRIATVENLQRQNMTPLEEAAALTKLVHKGVTLDDVVAQTGLSATTIKRRLALNALCREAKIFAGEGWTYLVAGRGVDVGQRRGAARHS